MAEYLKVTITTENLATGEIQKLEVDKARDFELGLGRGDYKAQLTMTCTAEQRDDGVIYTVSKVNIGKGAFRG